MSRLFVDWGGTYFRYEVENRGLFSKPSADIGILTELDSIFAKYPQIDTVCISFAGQVHKNKILSAPNIDIAELDLAEHFAGKRFFVENDLKCALLAESSYFKESSIAALYVGTGLGSAYMDDGKIISGCMNLAGEIGHIPYKTMPFYCGCGKNNCLELTASGSGLAKRVAKIDREFEEGVGYAASLIITMLNPKVLVLGGGIIKSNEYLVERVKEYVLKNSFPKSAKACDVRLSMLDDGSLEGAKLLSK